MDTSEEYINMCRIAEDIQAQWTEDTREYGDVFAEILSNGYITTDVFYSCPDEDNLWFVHNPVWLPRQDQLQYMITAHLNRESHGVIYDFIDWVEDLSTDETRDHRDYSIEQLWLAFVMHEVYGKIWNGKEWVVE